MQEIKRWIYTNVGIIMYRLLSFPPFPHKGVVDSRETAVSCWLDLLARSVVVVDDDVCVQLLQLQRIARSLARSSQLLLAAASLSLCLSFALLRRDAERRCCRCYRSIDRSFVPRPVVSFGIIISRMMSAAAGSGHGPGAAGAAAAGGQEVKFKKLKIKQQKIKVMGKIHQHPSSLHHSRAATAAAAGITDWSSVVVVVRSTSRRRRGRRRILAHHLILSSTSWHLDQDHP